MRTNLNCHVLGTSTAIFQMIILSMHLYTFDERHAWFHLYVTSRPARSASKATKSKMKNSCLRWDSNPQPRYLKSNALPIELNGLDESCTIQMIFLHTCTSNTNVYIGIVQVREWWRRAYFVLFMFCFVLHIGIYLLTEQRNCEIWKLLQVYKNG